jgi:hypothetical protein
VSLLYSDVRALASGPKSERAKKIACCGKKNRNFSEQRVEFAGNAGPYPVASGDKGPDSPGSRSWKQSLRATEMQRRFHEGDKENEATFP